MSRLSKTLFVIGFMGAGKTSVSAALSRRLGVAGVEMDARIAAREGMPVTEIFARKGEPHFRACETALLRELGASSPCVVSCGGGVPLREEIARIMRGCGQVLLLTASPEVILSRVESSTARPLLNGHMHAPYIAALMEARRPKYQAAATLTVDTSALSVEGVCDRILKQLDLL